MKAALVRHLASGVKHSIMASIKTSMFGSSHLFFYSRPMKTPSFFPHAGLHLTHPFGWRCTVNRLWCIDSHPAGRDMCALTSVGCSYPWCPAVQSIGPQTHDIWCFSFLRRARASAISAALLFFQMGCFAFRRLPSSERARRFMQMPPELKAASKNEQLLFRGQRAPRLHLDSKANSIPSSSQRSLQQTPHMM